MLLLLVYVHGKASMLRRAVVLTALAALAAGAFTGLVPRVLMTRAFEANTLVFMAARLPQIWSNFRSGSTGQLSGATCFMNMAGGLARVFTSWREGGSALMVRQYLLGFSLNLTLFLQILYYGKEKRSKPRAARPAAAAKVAKPSRQAKKRE